MWLLARHRTALFPPWLLRGWRGDGTRGRKAWPAVVLLTLMVLRWAEEGMSRLGSSRRAAVDIAWRAAMGLQLGAPTPSERTLRDFEAFLLTNHPDAGVPRFVLLHEHIVRVCVGEGVADGASWGADSTPMWCYGAVQDTVRLLGDGLRSVGLRYASLTRTPLATVARDWKLPLLLAKSTKGHFRADWRDADARAAVLTELADAAARVASAVRRTPGIHGSAGGRALLERCRNMLRVVEQNLEADETGRLVIARKVVRDRLVSITDPQARHGRKTRSVSFEGFKLHVLGDLVSGLIAAVSVAPANVHDNVPMHPMIARAQRAGAEFDRLLADTAYGSVRDRVLARAAGVQVIAPPQEPSGESATFRKEDFAIDFDALTATCPSGVQTARRTLVSSKDHGAKTPVFHWPIAACGVCPLREHCVASGRRGRKVELHLYERELREARADWTSERRKEYRERTRFERLNHSLTRHGGRQARAWGLRAANLQAHLIAMRCNLQLLAKRFVGEVNAAA